MSSASRRLTASHLRRHWRATLLLSVLVGLLGGATVAAVAGARRTDTAYDRLVRSVAFPDAAVQLLLPEGADVAALADQPGVERVRETSFAVGLTGESRNIVLLPVQAPAEPFAPFLVVDGRLPDPTDPAEISLSERMAREFDLEVGDTFRHTALSQAEWIALLDDTWDGSATGLQIELEVVGITRNPLDSVTDGWPTIFGTPAYFERLATTRESPRTAWLDLAPDVDAREVISAAGLADSGPILDFDQERSQVDNAASVLVNGLLVLGAIAAVATITVAAQVGARHADRVGPQLPVLGVLGATRRQRRGITLASAAPMALVAAGVTAAVAVVASRWTPVGVTRSIEPDPGTVVHTPAVVAGSIGVALLVLAATLVASRFIDARPHHRPDTVPSAHRPSSRLAGLIAAGPVGTVALGLTGDRGRLASPRRVATLGVGSGVAGLIAVVAFTTSLEELVTEPASWGQVADYEVNLPEPVRADTLAVLDTADEVAAYAEVVGDAADVAGNAVTAFWLVDQRGSIDPVIVDGRAPATSAEVALGPALLKRIDLEVGDAVEVDGAPKTIVGVALTPRSGDSGYADGALLGGSPAGPSDSRYTQARIRFHDDIDQAAAAAELFGDLEYGPITRPVDIDNLAALRPMLPLLVAVVAAVGMAALVHLGLATGSRARRELALLRALGMRPRQLRSAVILATAMLAAAGSLVVLPIAAILVRASWRAALAATHLVTGLSVPWLAPALLAPIAVLVVATGAVAGAHALRGPVSRTLRPE